MPSSYVGAPENNGTLVRYRGVGTQAESEHVRYAPDWTMPAGNPTQYDRRLISRGSVMGFLSTYWTDFIERFDGPLHFRLFVQPLMAILFAVRDGSRDAREGRSAYLWALLIDPAQRRHLLESGWKGISKVFVLAFALDVVYQFMVWHGLKPLQALLTATVLAVIPSTDSWVCQPRRSNV